MHYRLKPLLYVVLYFICTGSSCLIDVKYETICVAAPKEYLPIANNVVEDEILFITEDGKDTFTVLIKTTYASPSKTDECYEMKFNSAECDPRWGCHYHAYIDASMTWSDGNSYPVRYFTSGYGEPIDRVKYRFRDYDFLELNFPFEATAGISWVDSMKVNDKSYYDLIRQENPSADSFFPVLYYNRDYGVVIAETTEGAVYYRL